MPTVAVAGDAATTVGSIGSLTGGTVVFVYVSWMFTDPVTSERYYFETNPSSGGTPGLSKNMLYQNTAGANNKTVAMKGASNSQVVRVQGSATTQAHLDALATWSRKRYPINLRDDLGRTYLIYVENFDARREPSSDTPFKHTYTLTYFVVGQ